MRRFATAVLIAQAAALGRSARGGEHRVRGSHLGSHAGGETHKHRDVELNQDLIILPDTDGANEGRLAAGGVGAGGAGKYTAGGHTQASGLTAPVLPRVGGGVGGSGVGGGLRGNQTWKPGDPIGNNSIPLSVGLNYLQQMLQMAVEVEHSVIPPYLTALYSIIPDGTDEESWVSTTIKGVVIEEMLHMTIAANVLNAVGGHPAIDRPDFVPNYPQDLPALNLTVGIQPFDLKQAHLFRLIERPWNHDHQALREAREKDQPHSITYVYTYISDLMTALCKQHGEYTIFTGDPKAQITVDSPSTGETVNQVYNLSGAVASLMEVVHQGAGMSSSDPDPGPLGGEWAHYARFEEVYSGKMYQKNDTAASGPTGVPKYVNWTAIYKFLPNAKPDDYPVGSVAQAKLSNFAGNYTELLVLLHAAFNGYPETYIKTVEKMYVLKQMAVDLMQTPDPRFAETEGMTLGPVWMWVQNHSKYYNEWTGYSPRPPRPEWGC